MENSKKCTLDFLNNYLKNFLSNCNMLIDSVDFVESFNFKNYNLQYNNYIDDLFSDFAHNKADLKTNSFFIEYYSPHHEEVDDLIKDKTFAFDLNNIYDSILSACKICFSDDIIDKLQIDKNDIVVCLTIKYLINNINNFYNIRYFDPLEFLAITNNIIEKIEENNIEKITDFIDIINNEFDFERNGKK